MFRGGLDETDKDDGLDSDSLHHGGGARGRGFRRGEGLDKGDTSYVDIAGSIPAELRTRGPIVTRAVQAFEFKKPVYVGDLVSFYAEVIKEGRTSVTVQVDVYAQRIKYGIVETVLVTDAILVYVAIDENGQPRALPPR